MCINLATVRMLLLCVSPTNFDLIKLIYSSAQVINIFAEFLPTSPIDYRERVCVCMCVCVGTCIQLCLTLCDSMDCSLSGSSVQGILQVRPLEQIAISYFRDLSDSRIKPSSLGSPALVSGFFISGTIERKV